MNKRSARADLLRQALAREAARLMIEHGFEDYGTAKRKAAERMGLSDHAVLPRNTEIEQAVAEHHRLFKPEAHATDIEGMRRSALEAMQLLSEFEPRLVGPVLAGTASAHNDISLHLFTDSPESVALTLLEHRIPHELAERRLRLHRDEPESFPSVRFSNGDFDVDATVFPRDGIRQSPLSPVDGKPMRRASLQELEALVLGAG